MKEKQIVSVLWGDDHYEDSIEEMIHYMSEYEELTKEEIVGITVEFCCEADVYSSADYCKIQDILYSEADIYVDRYFEEKRAEIMKLIESVKYHEPFQKYIITEEDYNDVIK